MRKPDLDRIVRLQKKSQQLKTYAIELANQLIVKFDINNGLESIILWHITLPRWLNRMMGCMPS